MDITTLQTSHNTRTVLPRCSTLVARNAADFAVSLMSIPCLGLRLEIDLSGVRHVDSAGAGALLTCGQALKRRDCQMVLIGVEGQVKADLNACGLAGFLVNDAASLRRFR